MKYVAIHYVKVAGRMYSPGEIFAADGVAPEKIERLLAKKAIRKFPVDAETPATSVPSRVKPDAAEAPDTGDDDEPDESDEDEVESDEDPPEIDVMDGVAPPKTEPAPKPAPKPTAKKKAPARKKAAAKPAGK